MKRTQISELTTEQAMDELTFMELKKLLQTARKAEQKATEAHNAVYAALYDMCIDLDVPSSAENAENLGDAVSCYIHYGEYSLKSLLKEIRAQYGKDDKQ